MDERYRRGCEHGVGARGLALPTGNEAMASTQAATPPRQAFLDPFNAHDVDAIMSFFTEDCILDTPPRADAGRAPPDR
jgi:hypothetical protein